MRTFNNLDLVVTDVPAATEFFRNIVGLTVRVDGERYAEIDAGAVTIMLTPEIMVPARPAAGIILHFQVDDVKQAIEHARDQGALVLLEPFQTDWGWESAMIAGPAEVVVDFYKPLAEQ
jgi:predicted enzyme related to lactoylglutathione lyase